MTKSSILSQNREQLLAKNLNYTAEEASERRGGFTQMALDG